MRRRRGLDPRLDGAAELANRHAGEHLALIVVELHPETVFHPYGEFGEGERLQVSAAVVVHDHAIEAYLVLAEGAGTSAVEREITTRLAPFKRPRRLHVVEQLPRTATGKLVRDQAVLADIGTGQESAPRQEPGPAGDGARRRRPG